MTNSKQTETITVSIGGMGCAACSSRIEEAVLKLKGVESIAVDLGAGKAKVACDLNILPQSTITETITELGYDVLGIEFS